MRLFLTLHFLSGPSGRSYGSQRDVLSLDVLIKTRVSARQITASVEDVGRDLSRRLLERPALEAETLSLAHMPLQTNL
jgi:hypothetical protein